MILVASQPQKSYKNGNTIHKVTKKSESLLMTNVNIGVLRGWRMTQLNELGWKTRLEGGIPDTDKASKAMLKSTPSFNRGET